MMIPQGPLVDVAWLAEHRDEVIVLDASAMDHAGADTGIPGARRFDLDGALSDPNSDLPHTMPPADLLARRLGGLGIGDDAVTVSYDRAGLFSSPRAWWMLRAAGVGTPLVLDGGLPAWLAAGHPEGPLDAAPAPVPAPRVVLDPGAFIDADEVARRLAEDGTAVVDVRSAERFAGTAPEPRPGLRGGHMPGAVSVPFAQLAPGGHLLEPERLEARLRSATGGTGPVAFSCGSGLTACVGALAAVVAGRQDVTVYDGSWSEWGRGDDRHRDGDARARPVVTGP